jgi:hypothetical protein
MFFNFYKLEKNLLRPLQKCIRQSRLLLSCIRNDVGCTVAVDVYCWLHRAAFGCAEQLVQGRPTDAYIKYVMKVRTSWNMTSQTFFRLRAGIAHWKRGRAASLTNSGSNPAARLPPKSISCRIMSLRYSTWFALIAHLKKVPGLANKEEKS